MKAVRIILALGLALGVSACGSADLASRNAPLSTSDLPQPTETAQKRVVLSSQYNVSEIRITVPRTLKVSEANMFYPNADIVWRGEPLGDRYMQVHSIFTDAFGMGTATMKSGPEVIVEAEVVRFHGVTEKTRYTFGGVFNMKFVLTVRSAQTGEIIDGPRLVEANAKASGGSAAIEEEQIGRTQRVVVIETLRARIRQELSQKHEVAPVSRNLGPIALTPGRLMEQVPLPL